MSRLAIRPPNDLVRPRVCQHRAVERRFHAVAAAAPAVVGARRRASTIGASSGAGGCGVAGTAATMRTKPADQAAAQEARPAARTPRRAPASRRAPSPSVDCRKSRSDSQTAAPTSGPNSVPVPPIAVWITSWPEVSKVNASGGMKPCSTPKQAAGEARHRPRRSRTRSACSAPIAWPTAARAQRIVADRAEDDADRRAHDAQRDRPCRRSNKPRGSRTWTSRCRPGSCKPPRCESGRGHAGDAVLAAGPGRTAAEFSRKKNISAMATVIIAK